MKRDHFQCKLYLFIRSNYFDLAVNFVAPELLIFLSGVYMC